MCVLPRKWLYFGVILFVVEQSIRAALMLCIAGRQSVVATIKDHFSLSFLWCVYYSPRRGCPRVLKFCWDPHSQNNQMFGKLTWGDPNITRYYALEEFGTIWLNLKALFQCWSKPNIITKLINFQPQIVRYLLYQSIALNWLYFHIFVFSLFVSVSLLCLTCIACISTMHQNYRVVVCIYNIKQASPLKRECNKRERKLLFPSRWVEPPASHLAPQTDIR